MEYCLEAIRRSVTGRKSGRLISNPVWFVFENGELDLLPVSGSETQWHKNVLKNRRIKIDARGAEAELRAIPVPDAKQVSAIGRKIPQEVWRR